jgi:hypothetical protein
MKLSIVLTLAVCSWGCSKPAPQHHVDEKVAPLSAALAAPEGKTPCESAWNAFEALDSAAKKDRIPPPWTTFPAKDAFLGACGGLSADAQQCLIPKNQGNRAKCDPVITKLKASAEGQKFYALFGTMQ